MIIQDKLYKAFMVHSVFTMFIFLGFRNQNRAGTCLDPNLNLGMVQVFFIAARYSNLLTFNLDLLVDMTYSIFHMISPLNHQETGCRQILHYKFITI